MSGMDLRFEPLTITDVDQLSELATSLGWDIESIQLSAGLNEIVYDHCVFPDLVLGHYRTRQSMHSVFELPEGLVLFLITRAPKPLTWTGTELPPTRLGIAHAGRTHRVTLPTGWDCYEFMVSEALIRRTEVFPLQFFDTSLRTDHPVVPLPEPGTGRFLDLLDRLFVELRTANGQSLPAARRAEHFEFVLQGLQQIVDAGLEAPDQGPLRGTRRADLVERACTFLADRLDGMTTMDRVAQELGVSYRVLNYAFRDTLGVSPYRYYLTERLHATRRLLKSGDATVTKASTAYGFYTPSRFAMQYKRLFGELPSATGSPRTRRR